MLQHFQPWMLVGARSTEARERRAAERAAAAALEKPMPPDDDLRHCLLKILEQDVKALSISHVFATRMSKSIIPDYDIVKEPVCIEDINTSVMYGEYKNKGDFLADFQKMYKNSVTYNGKNDQVTYRSQSLS